MIFEKIVEKIREHLNPVLTNVQQVRAIFQFSASWAEDLDGQVRDSLHGDISTVFVFRISGTLDIWVRNVGSRPDNATLQPIEEMLRTKLAELVRRVWSIRAFVFHAGLERNA